MRSRFTDRNDAGRRLAERLGAYAGHKDVIVLALPRGGVPVGYEVARALDAELDVFLVRKIGLPGHEEFAMGAIASGGTALINDEVTRTYHVDPGMVDRAVEKERRELERREKEYRGGLPFPDLAGKTVILVDDGLATGSSMRAAVAAVRRHDPRWLVVAVPIAPPETCEALAAHVDDVVCAVTPEPFYAVGLWYESFSQMTDDEVTEILRRARNERAQAADNPVNRGARADEPSSEPAAGSATQARAVRIPAGDTTLEGDLVVPANAGGLVIFAHGSGSSRHSGRNRAVARALQNHGLATLLMDLLTREEESVDAHTGHLRFDIPFLARRLTAAAEWSRREEGLRQLPVGFFGASTGGGAALIAAADQPELTAAVVSRGGRPDLAGEALGRVAAPTLLIVGERDDVVIELNKQARAQMQAHVELVIVPRATHLFEEPGTLEEVARLAGDWFSRYLVAPQHAAQA